MTGAYAVLIALYHKKRMGKGQYNHLIPIQLIQTQHIIEIIPFHFLFDVKLLVLIIKVCSLYLSRIFVSELGVSFSKYVQDERLKRAVILLKKSKLTIKEISEVTGFISVQYFTRVFTSMMQCSPGRFRSLYLDLKTTTFSD
ncbi:helix-turn-helix transcriptional regulator [Neobacillus pocheonensis]|uniref:Helix-turn-helix transcriptional regulator n=1 Tax=Neobacillus pocheonensis TaxID=363869 RepID=A0ABT0W8D8_9BACI|nr:helix-turn-helix transcriptional regulator [Neobacillus pocheonensis]